MDTEKIIVNGTFVYRIETFSEWTNRFPGALPKLPIVEKYIFIDKNGNVAAIGEDFMQARDEDLFPIKVYLLQRTAHLKNPDYLKKLMHLFD